MKIRFFKEGGTHYGVFVPEVRLGEALSPFWRELKAFDNRDPLTEQGNWIWRVNYIKLWGDMKARHGLTPLKLDLEMKARGVSRKWRQRSGLDFFLGLNEEREDNDNE